MIYLDLFKAFFKIGLFTFGGGYSMLPLIEEEIVNKNKWATKDEVYDYFAVAQSFPGAIAINTSTLVGYKIAGKKGGIISTFGVILPSFIIILIIATFFLKIAHLEIVKKVFSGINAAIILLLLLAAIRIIKSSVRDKISILILLISLSLAIYGINPVLIIISAISLGVLRYFLERKQNV